MHPETRAVHVEAPKLDGAAPLSVPIYQTSGFAFDDAEVFADGLARPDGAFVYTRMSNPTVRALENALTDLEGGTAAIATASGMGAINATLRGLLRPGDHVIAQRQLYGSTYTALRAMAQRGEIEVDYVSGHDPDEVRKSLRDNTKVLYLETIGNPAAHVSDLPALAAVAREAGVRTVVDNTFATPILCRPIEQGADVVVHSITKYIGGHSDILGGVAVVADAELHRPLWSEAAELGVTPDPFAAWLAIRGLATLSLRMRQHCANAEVIANRLATHPSVASVFWPGLPGNPSHEIAKRVLTGGFGATFAFELNGGRAAGEKFATALRLAKFAPSLGGTETLVLHPASTSHRQLSGVELENAGVSPGMIRISVGIEHADDLVADLEQALDQV
ncbi:methionine-gamma-lyase [Herbihabitans rhizosphaerae]|uniref:homocysteine desulfhydrase n=1 Tax=Herbihabitans rhizosphaerae TaxID=1872711 RepID=A0A4Q7KPW7_9PSEU|nr:aminotransferase class I/II-fold pyridoxal phosphate-dependent enzyme [Herbihabitans rhizosphaerae]RZS37741.1 methionine-gamma-lyase [Herbihabitans rhizosphaerae]